MKRLKTKSVNTICKFIFLLRQFAGCYFVPLNKASTAKLRHLWMRLAEAPEAPRELTVRRRENRLTDFCVLVQSEHRNLNIATHLNHNAIYSPFSEAPPIQKHRGVVLRAVACHKTSPPQFAALGY